MKTLYLIWILSLVLVLLIIDIKPSVEMREISFGELSIVADVYDSYAEEDIKEVKLAYLEPLPNSILFVGDVLLARNVEDLMELEVPSYPYQGIDLSRIAHNPFIFGNFEASIPEIHKKTETNKINFSVNRKFIPAAAAAGFTHFSLANNHSSDYGDAAFVNTKNVMASSNLVSFGHITNFDYDSVTFLHLNGVDVATIALHTLMKTPSSEEIFSVLDYAAENSDFQIVYVHWGTEYENKSNYKQRLLAEVLVTAGADLIIGHHPHVVQEVDLIDSVPVFYSLGNYIFDQYFSNQVQEGLLLHLEFSDKLSIFLNPVTSIYQYSQPVLMNRAERKLFLSNLSALSSKELQYSVTGGVLELDINVATSSKIAMMKR